MVSEVAKSWHIYCQVQSQIQRPNKLYSEKGEAMNLQQRAQEIVDDLYILCPLETHPKYTGKCIVTVKKDEVICWPFECLICQNTNCLFLLKE